MKIIKRDGAVVPFDHIKIYNAIMKAMKYGSGIIDEEIAKKISEEIEETCRKQTSMPTIKDVEKYIKQNVDK